MLVGEGFWHLEAGAAHLFSLCPPPGWILEGMSFIPNFGAERLPYGMDGPHAHVVDYGQNT